MAKLAENPEWVDDIYQIETSDPVLAGPTGIANLQPKQLACRTQYLKEKVDELEGKSLLLPPVGIPHPWPTAIPPAGWLKCNGSPFNKTMYPQLALAYPSGILPDLRGEFIRGWDDGRGVDSGRSVLSTQQASKVGGELYGSNNVGYGGQWWCDQDVPHDGWEQLTSEIMNKSPAWGRVTEYVGNPIATSVSRYTGYIRPRNIAFNYIVRAA